MYIYVGIQHSYNQTPIQMYTYVYMYTYVWLRQRVFVPVNCHCQLVMWLLAQRTATITNIASPKTHNNESQKNI